MPTSEYFWAVVALVLVYSAYVAEVYRAGIQSVHPSQVAAARSLGLSRWQSMRHVVLPQAIRRVIPPLLNDFIGLQKDSALVAFLGVIEGLQQATIIQQGDFNFTPFVALALVYIVITIPQARVVDRHHRARPAPPAGGAGDVTESVRIEGLHKSFGDLEVLKGIDLVVDRHQVVCLIGASGSGKSTLLRCINLLEPIDAGRIAIEGIEITAKGVDVDAVRRRIGIVFQAFNLFPHMTILRNVALSPEKVLKQHRREAETNAQDLLERFGLGDKADEYPDRLSGGQQQRVAIVRALAMQPDILLLDEVTSALDPVLVAEVLDAIRELAEQGMTMVIATHEMGFARDVANGVAFLHEGRILEEGPPGQDLQRAHEPRDPALPRPDHRRRPDVRAVCRRGLLH